MQKSQNINFNFAGKTSCLLLLLLTFLVANPMTGSVYAEEIESSYDDQIAPAAESNSGVTISFSPTSGSASLTPVTNDGARAKINVRANVHIASTGGYSIHLGGENANLTGQKTGYTINATPSAVTFDNLGLNTWGYAVSEGENIADSVTYSALPPRSGNHPQKRKW